MSLSANLSRAFQNISFPIRFTRVFLPRKRACVCAFGSAFNRQIGKAQPLCAFGRALQIK